MALGALLAPRPARGAEPPRGGEDAGASRVRVVWVRASGAESCDDEPRIRARVGERLGRDVADVGGSPMQIEAIVAHEGERWGVHLYVRDDTGRLVGSRDLETRAADCQPVEAAAVLAISLAIDPEAPLRPEPLPPPPVAPVAPRPSAEVPPSAPAVALVPSVAPPKRRAAAPEPSAFAIASGGATFGLLPAPSPAAALSNEFRLATAVRATAGVLYLPEDRDAAWAFGLTAGWLGLCAPIRFGTDRLELSACAKQWLGAIHVVVYTLMPTFPGDRVWSAFSLAVHARLRVAGPVWVEVGSEAVLPYVRYQFLVHGSPDPSFEEGAVGALVSGGAGLSIP